MWVNTIFDTKIVKVRLPIVSKYNRKIFAVQLLFQGQYTKIYMKFILQHWLTYTKQLYRYRRNVLRIYRWNLILRPRCNVIRWNDYQPTYSARTYATRSFYDITIYIFVQLKSWQNMKWYWIHTQTYLDINFLFYQNLRKITDRKLQWTVFSLSSMVPISFTKLFPLHRLKKTTANELVVNGWRFYKIKLEVNQLTYINFVTNHYLKLQRRRPRFYKIKWYTTFFV